MEAAEDSFSSASSLSSLDPAKIYLQLNNYDFYMAKPSALLDTNYGKSLPLNKFDNVPIIRVYGCLPSGHQVLCHIHGVFPYIFINYDGNIDTDSSSLRNQKCSQLHRLLESKMNIGKSKPSSTNTTNINPTNNQAIGNLKYIADVSLVKAVPFYGYHVGWSAFYKVSLLNPSYVNRLSDLFRNGAVFDQPVETFESHIPYLLQFTADYNLFGCYWIKLTECYFRSPILNEILDINNLMMNEDLKHFLSTFCKGQDDVHSNILPHPDFKRIGNGLLEVDVLPFFIENRKDLHFRDLHHDFIEKMQNGHNVKVDQYVTSTKQMVKDIVEQRRNFGLDPYKIVPDINRNNNEQTWQRTKENRDIFIKGMKQTRFHFGGEPHFNNFVHLPKKFNKIPRTEESLSNLWPNRPESLSSPIPPQPSPINQSKINTTNEHFSDSDSEPANSGTDSEEELDDKDKIVEKKNDDNLFSEDTSSSNVDKNTQKFSLDLSLTQRNTNKRKKRLQFSNSFESKSRSQSQSKSQSQSQSQSQLPLQSQSQLATSKRQKRNQKYRYYSISKDRNPFIYRKPSVDFQTILQDLEEQGYPIVEYKDPFFSNPLDLENKQYVYAGKRFEITSPHLSDRIPVQFNNKDVILENKINVDLFTTWKYIKKPPSFKEVFTFNTTKFSKKKKHFQSQIDMASSHHNDFLYKFGSGDPLRKGLNKIQNHLTHFSLEIHVNTREDKRPDPLLDEVNMICWVLEDDTYPFDLDMEHRGIMVVNKDLEDKQFINKIECAAAPTTVAFYESEFDMFDALTDLILLFDPDILSGFEVHMSSWGYIIDRCTKIYKFNILEEIPRVATRWKSKSKDIWGYSHSSGISITGRYMLNIWRIMRTSYNLNQYSLENLTNHVLHYRLPHFSYSFLTFLWSPKSSITQLKTVLSYVMKRVEINILLLKKDDFIERTTEFSRLLGIDFHSVFYRGSQYKVESFLVRICKSESFLLNSPSKQAVRKQKPLECVPLVMEPQSTFYKSPMVVLDFQSLYPSIMIGYNYCYSTMIGRVDTLNLKSNEIGTTHIPLRENLLQLLKDDVNLSPNGVVFVNKSIRKSTLAKMLKEILDIRVMVKKTMAEMPHLNESLKKQLNNKQLALKLLANVTYGYASASFSGRMPCSDLADTIVQTGRETLEKAVDMIENNDEWGAKVVYGDTDSLFVYLPGKTKEDAFRIGNEISLRVSENNPKPIFLKFEKVYHPSILVTKKRYVGYSYEKPTQKEPSFDSKGIETVRRDGHPAQQKIVEKAIKILFNTSDLSLVKKYVQSQFTKLYEGKVSIQDFCFAKEVKLGSYKSDTTAPAGAVVAKKQMESDHRAEPQYKERVPYLVVRGKAGEILRNRSISPVEFLANPELSLDADYYIDKTLIPPLSRLFNVMGINVEEWKSDLTRFTAKKGLITMKEKNKVGDSILCSNCGGNTIVSQESGLCKQCCNDTRNTALELLTGHLSREKQLKNIMTICRTCTYKFTKDANLEGQMISDHCDSYDCPIYYSRLKTEKYLTDEAFIRKGKALDYLNKW